MADDAASRIKAALAHHQEGRLDAAEALYRDALDANPDQPDALNLLGVAMLQRERYKEAVELFRQAVAVDDGNPAYHTNMATALLETGQAEQAIEHNRRALAIDPDHLDAVYNLGNAYRAAGDHAAAERQYRRTIELDRGNVDAYGNLAICLAARGEHLTAIEVLEQALAMAPDAPEIHHNMALTLQALRRLDGAVQHYRRALELDPDRVDYLNHLGTALEQAAMLDEAEQCYGEALRRQPDYADAHLNMGNLLRHRGRPDAALEAYQRAARLDPDSPHGHTNLGMLLSQQGRRAEGLEMLERARRLQPDRPETLVRISYALLAGGRLDDALNAVEQALALRPGHGEALHARAVVNLLQGRYEAGWRDYLHRNSMVEAERFHRAPLDADLAGRHVLVERDQGLGDEIFFLRFLPLLRRRGARISYLPDARLADMIGRSGLADRVLGPSESPGDVDFHVTAGDLPYLLGMADTDPVPPSAAIPPLAEQAAAMQARLTAAGPAPYCGLTWRAGTLEVDGILFKQAPVADLAAALRQAPVTFIALQRLPAEGEIAGIADLLGKPVHDFTAINDDLEAMLALVGLLDHYICVSNTNLHLRATQGRTAAATHVLVPNPPDFRWMAAGDASPWFPQTRLYRQDAEGGWSAAFAALSRDVFQG